jgi:hypothetical protein
MKTKESPVITDKKGQPREETSPRIIITWPDKLTAILLLFLGIAASGYGLMIKSSLASGFFRYEIFALTIIVAGIWAFRGGIRQALEAIYPRMGENLPPTEEMPSIAYGLPFFVFGLACFLLAAVGFNAGGHAALVGTLTAAATGSIVFSLIIILLHSIWRRGKSK